MNSFYRIILALLIVIGTSISAQAQIDWGDGSSGDWTGGTDVDVTPGTGTGHVTSIQLSASRLLLSGGETAQLVAVVNADAANKMVTWSVVDPAIASVSENGLVTALTTGQTVVTATAVDGGMKAQCLVTVKNNALVYVERIELDKTELTMYVGETALITPTVYPSNASNKQVGWGTEILQDCYIPCSITQEGYATAIKPGRITYVVRPQDGADVIAKVQITVKDKPVSSITLPSTITLNINEMKTLNPEVTPALMQPMFHWTTADPSIAYVNASGRIIGRKAGETTVTATAIDGTGKSCSARVVVSSNEANWGYSGWVLERGENVHPWTARYYNEHDVFEIGKDNNGKAWYELGFDDSSWRYGYGPMTFYCWHGGLNQDGYAAFGQWNDPEADLFVRQEFYMPDVNGYDFNLYGRTTNGSGDVYLNGKKIAITDVTGWEGKGTYMAQLDRSQLNMGGMNVIAIRARHDNWTQYVDFGIHYEASVPVTRIILSEKQVTLPRCATHKLSAIIKPNEATRPNLTWKSSDEHVARVQNDGTVLTLSPGKVVISACATDGSGVVGICEVTVTEEFGTEESLPLLPRGSVLLSYVGESYNKLPKDNAGNDCTSMDFDDSQWKPAQLAMVYQYGDEYNGETYYFRHKFPLPDVKGKYVLRMDSWFTGRSKFWINGVLIGEIYEHEGHQRDIPAELLNYGGENILTVSRQTDGQFIFDCWMDLVKILPVESITLSQTSVTLDQEQQTRLEAYVKPDNAYNREVKWTSDNPTIASVDDWGNVTGMGEGNANITATAADGSGVEARCQVTVTIYINIDGQRVEVKPVTAVTLDKTSITLKQNQRDKLTATVTPADAYYKEVKWTTSNPDVVTVDQEGNIRGCGAGTATITVTNTHGKAYSATCQVTVTDEVMPLQPGDWVLPNGDEGPWNAKVIYATSGHPNHDVEPSADAAGKPWTALDYDDSDWQQTQGPFNRNNGNWPHDDSRYYVRRKFVVGDLSEINSIRLWVNHDDNATIYLNGILVADCPHAHSCEYLLSKELLLPGENIICANVYQGGGDAYIDMGLVGCTDEIKKATELYFEDTEFDVYEGETIQLQLIVLPDDVHSRTFEWESSDNTVATVSNSGVVTCLAAGSATITARTTDGSNLTATCRVHVRVKKVVLDWGANEPWKAKYLYQDVAEQFVYNDPADDSEGHSWTALDYDDTAWDTMTGPMGIDIWYSPYNYTWSGEYNRHWLRRKFEVDFDLTDKIFVFECMHDDDIQVYLNGELVVDDKDWTDERHVSFEIPTSCFVSGTNILAIRHYQGWGGAFLDYTITYTEITPVTAVTLDKTSITLKQNQKDKLTATVMPADAYYKEVRWTTSNPDVVSVDQKGNIHAGIAGTATVTVTNTHGTPYSATCQVTVTDEIMPLKPGDWLLPNGDEGSWNAKVIYAPQGHANHDVEPADDADGNNWTSLNYNDDGWLSAEGPFYRDRGNWPDEDSRYYVRRRFTVGDLSGINSIRLWVNHDDNATIYLNGTMVTDCPHAHSCEYLLSRKLLRPGENIICANVYQGGGDAYIDFGLMGSDERYIEIVNITYMVDGEVYRTEDVESGSVIELPAAPVKDGYTFYRWDGLPADMIMPDYDLTLTAVFAIRGDVNLDEKVNITDAVDIVNDRLGYESTNFMRVLSDVNRDDLYTITDAIGVINIMYGEPVGSYAPRRMEELSCESLELSMMGSNIVALDMNCTNGYSAFQFDVELPEGTVLDSISLNKNRCKDFAVRFNKVEGNIYKVVAYNLANEPLTVGNDNLLTLNISGTSDSDEVRLTNIHFSTQKAVDVLFEDLLLNMSTGIQWQTVSCEAVEYNVSGLRVNKAYRGIVIVNGKKVIRE